jgi:hypothetical protein
MSNKLLFNDGEKFGKWTVLRKNGSTDEGKLLYLCRCECGTESNVISSNLKKKYSESCVGCSKNGSIGKQKKRKLSILTEPERLRIKLDYDSGISSEKLSIKYNTSVYTALKCVKLCGGVVKKNIRYKKNPNEIAKNRLYISYKCQSNFRKIPFHLSKKQFYKMVLNNCFYCGSPPTNIKVVARGGKFLYNGIDRKNTNGGYVYKNCVSCCKICNRAKSNMIYVDFVNWIKNIKLQQQGHHKNDKGT